MTKAPTPPAPSPLDAVIDLIARLEAATAGARILDAQIVVALNLRPEWCKTAGDLWVDTDCAEPVVRCHDPKIGKRSGGNVPIGDYPHFTTSIDAALTLVPEGALNAENCLNIILYRPEIDDSGNALPHDRVVLTLGHGDECAAKSIPLALCIAALRAHFGEE